MLVVVVVADAWSGGEGSTMLSSEPSLWQAWLAMPSATYADELLVVTMSEVDALVVVLVVVFVLDAAVASSPTTTDNNSTRLSGSI